MPGPERQGGYAKALLYQGNRMEPCGDGGVVAGLVAFIETGLALY